MRRFAGLCNVRITGRAGMLWSLLLSGGLLLQSCGTAERSESPRGQAIQAVQVGEGVFPALSGQVCQQGIDMLGSYDLFLWNGTNLANETIDLGNWTSVPQLSDPLVERMIYGYEELTTIGSQCQNRQTKSEWMDPYCRDRRELVSQGLDLRLCQQLVAMNTFTLEATAITVAGQLEQIQNFYLAAGNFPRLEPLKVFLFPNVAYQTSFPVDGSYVRFSVTDNAAWGRRLSSERSENILYIFPMSRDYLATRTPDRAIQFWQVPWIMAHEFGHHIFYNFLREKSRQYFGFDFQGVTGTQLFHQGFAFRGAATPFEDRNFTSINEGFADLIAHYFRGESTFELTQLACVFRHRDVSSSQLTSKMSKRFTTDWEFDENSTYCDQVDPNAVHVQGSILAYFIDQYWDRLLNMGITMQKADVALWKMSMTMDLLDRMAIQLEERIDTEMKLDLWTLTVESAVRQGEAVSGMAPSPGLCQFIDDVFNDYWTYPRTMSEGLGENCRFSEDR